MKFNSKRNGYDITKFASEVESCKQDYKRNGLSLTEPELQLKMRNTLPGDMETAIIFELMRLPTGEWFNALRKYQIDGLVPKAPNKAVFFTGGGTITCFNCGGPHPARECTKPKNQAKFDANLEAFRAAKSVRRGYPDRRDKGSRDGKGPPKPRGGHGNGRDPATPKWGKAKQEALARKRKDRHTAKVLLAAFKASEAKAATPDPTPDPATDRDAEMAEWAREYKPPQVPATAGNATTYSIQTPQRLGRAGMSRK